MKKFKNDQFYVKGSKNLLEAFKNELVEVGYTNLNSESYKYKEGFIKLYPDTGQFQYLLTKVSSILKEFNLPQDWNEALSYALEEIKQPKYKVGDFVVNVIDHNDLGYICSIENGLYNAIWELDKLTKNSLPIEIFDNNEGYKKESDENALNTLIKHYTEKGIKVDSVVNYGELFSNSVVRKFDLVKNQSIGTRNYGVNSVLEQGDSQLAIFISTDSYWITPSTTGFKVKEDLMIGKYEVKKVTKEVEGLQIGCKFISKDAVGVMDSFSNYDISFKVDGGIITVTKKDMKEALNMFK